MPEKRKANDAKEPRPKRSRLRLHCTNVTKRVRRIADRIKSLKAEYLDQCRYVGLIIDEGNNFSRTCPLYAATISCDSTFNWRIQFVGQADSEGKKSGESIYEIVKQIFTDAGLEAVWERIECAGTDGASVMRSTADYSGELLDNIPASAGPLVPPYSFTGPISYTVGLDCRGTEGRQSFQRVHQASSEIRF